MPMWKEGEDAGGHGSNTRTTSTSSHKLTTSLSVYVLPKTAAAGRESSVK